MTTSEKPDGAQTIGSPVSPTPSPNHTSNQTSDLPLRHKIYTILSWTPPRCRWDPEKPHQFSMGLNVLFAFASGFTVANLYYTHPILNILAHDFHVPYEKVAQIPTVMQAGYAAGLLFLCPLGDLLPRRPFVTWLVLFTATMWYAFITLPVYLIQQFGPYGIGYIRCTNKLKGSASA